MSEQYALISRPSYLNTLSEGFPAEWYFDTNFKFTWAIFVVIAIWLIGIAERYHAEYFQFSLSHYCWNRIFQTKP